MSTPPVAVEMIRAEGAQLAQLVDDFRALVGSDRDLTDPALTRLTPTAYPDDHEAAEAFRAATRDDLLDRRSLDADIVRAALLPMRGDLNELTEIEALAPQVVEIAPAEIDAWLRTLSALRLVVADRLGITSEDSEDETDPRRGVYEWLGYRLELLIEAADESL